MGLPQWTWPDWRKAKPGTRFRHVRNGHLGTFVKPSGCKHNGALVIWDGQTKIVNFVTIALDGEPINQEES